MVGVYEDSVGSSVRLGELIFPKQVVHWVKLRNPGSTSLGKPNCARLIACDAERKIFGSTSNSGQVVVAERAAGDVETSNGVSS